MRSHLIITAALLAAGSIVGLGTAGRPVLSQEAFAAGAPAAEFATANAPSSFDPHLGELAALPEHNREVAANVQKDGKQPNILIIWGDDVGMWNINAYHRGMMGGKTPNIDRIAKDGMIFMDHYAQAFCTAGRAAFITGQYPIRVGLATVGLPSAWRPGKSGFHQVAQGLPAPGEELRSRY